MARVAETPSRGDRVARLNELFARLGHSLCLHVSSSRSSPSPAPVPPLPSANYSSYFSAIPTWRPDDRVSLVAAPRRRSQWVHHREQPRTPQGHALSSRNRPAPVQVSVLHQKMLLTQHHPYYPPQWRRALSPDHNSLNPNIETIRNLTSRSLCVVDDGRTARCRRIHLLSLQRLALGVNL